MIFNRKRLLNRDTVPIFCVKKHYALIIENVREYFENILITALTEWEFLYDNISIINKKY